MAHYQAANMTAATELIQRVSPALLRYFLLQQSTRSEADDLVQETWLRIHRVRHTYRAGGPLLPWIFAIARFVRIDGFRKRHRIDRNEQQMETLPDYLQAQPENAPTLPRLEELLNQLPESQREILILMKVTGLSLEETARATSLTVGAVKQKASRAYAKLRAVLQQVEKQQ